MATDQEDCSENCIAIKYVGQKVIHTLDKVNSLQRMNPYESLKKIIIDLNL